MKVAPTPQPSQSAGEMSAKATELEDTPAGAFFAEIDRALNMGEQEEVPNEEKASDQSSETNGNNDLSLFLRACLFAVQPVKTESGEAGVLLDPSGSIVREHADEESGKSLDSILDASEESATPSPSGSLKTKKFISDTEGQKNLFENTLLSFQTTTDLAAQNSATPAPGALSNAGRTEPDGEFRATLDERALSAVKPSTDSAAPNQQKTDQNPVVSTIHSEPPAPGGSIPMDAFGKTEAELKADSQYQENTAVIRESRQELPAERLMAGGKNSLSRNFTASKNENNQADMSNNIESGGQEGSDGMDARIANSVRAASETMSMSGSRADEGNGNSGTTETGGARADQTKTHSESPAWMALQIKLENPAADSGKAKASMFEHTQEKMVGLAANFESSTGANISAPGINAAAPSRPGELVYQIADRIQVQFRDGKNEIRIQLKPESLGSLEIRAEVTANGVVAHITAESSAVKNYLEHNLHLLQQNLQDQGLKVERIQIAVQEVINQQSSSDQSAQFGHAASGGRQWGNSHKPSHAAGGLFSSTPEEITVDPLTVITAGSPSRFHTIA
jgi:flagellar hook-length control protein FliK